MKHKFKLKKKKNLISINMSIVIITMLMFAIGVGYSKFSTTLNIRGTIIGKKPETHEEDYIVENEDENTLVLNTDKVNPSNPVAVSDLLTMEFTGVNITQKHINRMDVTLNYTTGTGSAQTIVYILTVNNNQYRQTVNFRGKQTNQNVTISFTGLNINPNQTFTITSEVNKLSNRQITINNQTLSVYLTD